MSNLSVISRKANLNIKGRKAIKLTGVAVEIDDILQPSIAAQGMVLKVIRAGVVRLSKGSDSESRNNKERSHLVERLLEMLCLRSDVKCSGVE